MSTVFPPGVQQAPTGPRSVPTAIRRAGYLLAATINAVLLWASHQLLDWGWPAFLTADFAGALDAVTASLVAAIVANLVLALHHDAWIKVLADLVTAGFTLAAMLRLLEVFPFDFTGYATDWSGVGHGLLILLILATGIAIVANLIKLVTGSGLD